MQYSYDGFGQIATESQAANDVSGTVSYSYDASHDDRLTGITYPNGRTINYNYNSGLDSSISRLSSISDSNGTIQSYTYMGLGTPVTFTDGNGMELSYLSSSTGDAGDHVTGLDRFGRIVDQSWESGYGSTPSVVNTDETQYGYDADGNITIENNPEVSGDSEQFTYDGLNRLTSFQRGEINDESGSLEIASEDENWNLDALGNITSSYMSYGGGGTYRTTDSQNQVTTIQTVGSDSTTTSATLAYDNNGNTTTDQNGDHYTYNAWNQLVQVKNSSGTVIAGYAYDALGRQASETYGSTTTDLYYSQCGQVVQEQNQTTGTVTAQNVWSPFYVNGLVERDDEPNTSGVLIRRLYAETDANYDITSLSSAEGDVVERFVYEPYGAKTTLTATGSATTDAYGMLYGFQGGRTDPVTGLVRFGVRYENTVTDVWTQPDPAGYINGADLYQFVESNPVGSTDPSGLQVKPSWIPPDPYSIVAPGDANNFITPTTQPVTTTQPPTYDPNTPQMSVNPHTQQQINNDLDFQNLEALVRKGKVDPNAARATEILNDNNYKLVPSLIGAARESGGDIAQGLASISADSPTICDGNKTPNPYGKLGGPAHQAEVQRIVQDILSRGLIPETEAMIPTPDGTKGKRFVDVVARDANGNIVEMHQVGLQTNSGVPVSRERAAINDIQNATGQTPQFHPYNK